MKEIDCATFKSLLKITDDDYWFKPDVPEPGILGQARYRIANGAVRAVPLGLKVDDRSSEAIRPLIRDPNYTPIEFVNHEDQPDEIAPFNPTGAPDAELLRFPADVSDVIGFLDVTGLWWKVDRRLWQELGLPDRVTDASQTVMLHPDSKGNREPRQREINCWLRDTWETESRLGGAKFFHKLRNYQNKAGSPIRQWLSAGKDAGIEYETSAGSRKTLSKKAIQNKVSEWKQITKPDTP